TPGCLLMPFGVVGGAEALAAAMHRHIEFGLGHIDPSRLHRCLLRAMIVHLRRPRLASMRTWRSVNHPGPMKTPTVILLPASPQSCGGLDPATGSQAGDGHPRPGPANLTRFAHTRVARRSRVGRGVGRCCVRAEPDLD